MTRNKWVQPNEEKFEKYSREWWREYRRINPGLSSATGKRYRASRTPDQIERQRKLASEARKARALKANNGRKQWELDNPHAYDKLRELYAEKARIASEIELAGRVYRTAHYQTTGRQKWEIEDLLLILDLDVDSEVLAHELGRTYMTVVSTRSNVRHGRNSHLCRWLYKEGVIPKPGGYTEEERDLIATNYYAAMSEEE